MEQSQSKPDTGRRSFLWKAGAAMTAAAAAAVPGMAKRGDAGNSDADRLAHRLGTLEDEKAIRALVQTYEGLLERGEYEKIAGLFAADAAVVFHGGTFHGKEGVSRLYREHFGAGRTGRKIGPAPGVPAGEESITVAGDRRSASAQFPYSIQVGAPMPDSPLVQMARLQGGGILRWCESGIYELSCAKEGTDGGWKIARLEHRVLSSTDYRPGRAYADPVSVPRFAKTYPADPSGPDLL